MNILVTAEEILAINSRERKSVLETSQTNLFHRLPCSLLQQMECSNKFVNSKGLGSNPLKMYFNLHRQNCFIIVKYFGKSDKIYLNDKMVNGLYHLWLLIKDDCASQLKGNYCWRKIRMLNISFYLSEKRSLPRHMNRCWAAGVWLVDSDLQLPWTPVMEMEKNSDPSSSGCNP